MENLSTISYLDQLVDVIKTIDTTDLSDDVSKDSISKVIEEQKVYFWIRLYLSEEDDNIQIGDDITIQWTRSGEELKTKFICYDKMGLDKDKGETITNFVAEDNKKVLCLMIDEKMVNNNDDIPFIRTLFKTGNHYEYQLMKRDELLFINDRNGIFLDYYECGF
jgi:hypothetical protein